MSETIETTVTVEAPKVLSRLRNRKVAAAATLVVVVVGAALTAKFAKDHVDIDVNAVTDALTD